MNTRKIIIISVTILIAALFLPVIIFSWVFSELPISHQVQDWSNFGSYIGGIYSALFGFFSTAIVCLTLLFTIKYNKEQIEQIKKQHFSSLINIYAENLNSKLDKKIYSYFHPESGCHVNNNESTFLVYILKRYNNNYDIEILNHKSNNPEDKRQYHPNVLRIGINTISELEIKYSSEIGNLIQILNLINSSENLSTRKELLSQFQAVTHRDRMFWMMLYAYANIPSARESIAFNEGLLIAAEGVKRSTGCIND
ncbi:hypothetical protein LGL98_03280 [Klebsiella africana]|uniref:hypothetical protein n=3 Tax=Klebsiella africana TaxID=2489010 RepID=UPI001932BB0E|nr:hypothetical protein [Klebsiella africana]QRF13234.1 hypothetical protein H1X61_03265 [Klebsiella africana]UDD40997.1 hypothetical protein LGL98_03280 [Klebsiella africana]